MVVTKKWQDNDLVWPHSDVDLRIILEEPPADWVIFNEQLAQVQRELVDADPICRRHLEHPPGWVFLRRELDAGLVPAAEVSTWSHCFGDQRAVERWRREAISRPWSAEDERFYHSILAARADGAYRLEADSAENVVIDADQYGAHCVSWHYLAPIVFAIACLTMRKRLSGKTEAFQVFANTAVTEFLQLANSGYKNAPAPSVLLEGAHRAASALPDLPVAGRLFDGMLTPAEVTSSIGLLRCRIARCSYYLHPPIMARTGYLIDRETKDLHGATRTLHSACGSLPLELRALAERYLALVPPPPTTQQSLRALLESAASQPRLVQQLFSAGLFDATGLTS